MSDSRKAPAVCPESTIDSAPRRDFVKKAALLGAATAIGSTILGSRNAIPASVAKSSCCYCPPCVCIVRAFSEHNDAVIGTSEYAYGVYGDSYCSVGVWGKGKTTGVYGYGTGCFSYGVQGCGPTGVVGSGRGNGSVGVSGRGSTGVYGSSCCFYGVYGNTLKGCGVYGKSTCGHGVNGESCTAAGIFGKSQKKYGVHGCSVCSAGVLGTGKTYGVQGCTASTSCSAGVAGFATGGCSIVTYGVYGKSGGSLGIGVAGIATHIGCGHSIGVVGSSSASCGIGVHGVAGSPCTVPFVASGTCGQVADLQEWNKSGKTLSAVNQCGWLGVGRPCAPTTLAVCGSMSARVATPCGPYTLKNTDFTVLANGNITLPLAGNVKGMIVFIKNIGTASIKVSVSGSDHIEGKSFETLSKQYKSLTLVSDGKTPGNWYILSNAT